MSKSKASRFLEKIAVESEPGLTTSQLMLVNHDLKPGKYSINLQLIFGIHTNLLLSRARTSTMGCLEFCRILDRRLFQHRKYPSLLYLVLKVTLEGHRLEHMDDIFIYDSRWPILVAILDLVSEEGHHLVI